MYIGLSLTITSRNVAFKARKLRESIMEDQDSFIMRQPEDVEAEFGEDDEDVVVDAGNLSLIHI